MEIVKKIEQFLENEETTNGHAKGPRNHGSD
jgi:hypothetical protein